MSALNDARQAALAVEHRAVFAYGVLGPRLGGVAAGLAHTSQQAHEQLRDDTQGGLRSAGVNPVPPEADYPAAYSATTPKAAIGEAITLETEAAAAWHFVYVQAGPASTSGAAQERVRDAAQAALTGCAVRATQWRMLAQDPTPTVAFPGI